MAAGAQLMFSELRRPVSFLRIQHASRLPSAVNWAFPSVATVLCGLVGIVLPTVDVFGGSGLLSKLLGFVQSLPGFYLAALAAVATFAQPGMDKLLPGDTPKGTVLYNNAIITTELTRRRLLCSMFAFLTLESVLLTVAAIAATTLAPEIRSFLSSEWRSALKLLFSSGYLLFFWQMMFITLWGLFYLGERMHTPDP